MIYVIYSFREYNEVIHCQFIKFRYTEGEILSVNQIDRFNGIQH